MGKKGRQFCEEKIGVTPSVAVPGDINPSDAMRWAWQLPSWQRITFKTAVVMYNASNMHAQMVPDSRCMRHVQYMHLTRPTRDARRRYNSSTDYWIQTSSDDGCRHWRIALQCCAFSQASALVDCSDTRRDTSVHMSLDGRCVFDVGRRCTIIVCCHDSKSRNRQFWNTVGCCDIAELSQL